MKTSELRGKAKEELASVIVSSKKELFNMRMQQATGELQGTGRFKELKKTVARAKTLLNEKSDGAKNSAPKKVAEKKTVAKKKKD
jgi:large subunit ribosomal protein L29